jgi:UDP-N-acetylmuramate dehydrogenase
MDIHYNVSLQPYNSFGVKVCAEAFAVANTLDDLHTALHAVYTAQDFQRLLVLGSGSNILFTGDVAGLVLKNNLRGITLYDETPDWVTIDVGAGERWDDLVQHCVSKGWGGIENLSMIPGTVGAAPVQNIGAYGVELKDVLVSVQGLAQGAEQRLAQGAPSVAASSTAASATASTIPALQTFLCEDCAFGYRDSLFKRALRGAFIITSVRLRLRNESQRARPESLNTRYGAIEKELASVPAAERTIADVSAAVRRIRASKLPDPAQLGNAGSFFKNPEIPRVDFERLQSAHPEMPSFPATSSVTSSATSPATAPSANALVKLPAGWLIEQCGWKGKRVGNTGAHADQALVLVNYGNATGAEVQAHAERIRASVHERFGVRLETEVNVL